jgi:hypothetical protein
VLESDGSVMLMIGKMRYWNKISGFKEEQKGKLRSRFSLSRLSVRGGKRKKCCSRLKYLERTEIWKVELYILRN